MYRKRETQWVFDCWIIQFNFYEASRSSEEDSTELVFFTVFSLPTLALLIASHTFGSILQFLIASLRKHNGEQGVKSGLFLDYSYIIWLIVRRSPHRGHPCLFSILPAVGANFGRLLPCCGLQRERCDARRRNRNVRNIDL